MGLLDKLLPDGMDIKDIERRAVEAEKRAIESNLTQDNILAELKKLNGTLMILQHAAELWVKKNL